MFTFALVVLGVNGLYAVNQSDVNAASITGVCKGNPGTNDIAPGGVHSQADIRNHINKNTCGDVAGIYSHYWIPANLSAGDKVYSGTADNKGQIIANGRVVANNASSIGRQPIAGSHIVKLKNGKTYYETTHVGGQAFKNKNGSLAALVVLDKDGNFKYAVVKDCGNPIYAHPVAPPKPPKPQPKDIQVCDLASRQMITIKEDQFDDKKHSKNPADCEMIEVCELSSKTVIKIPASQFDSKKHSKNLADCKEPEMIEVCDLETKTIIKINEDAFDSKKYSKDLKDCEEKCPLPGKENYPKESEECIACVYDTTLPADSPDCKKPETPTPVTPVTPTPSAPAELPVTGGLSDVFGASLGLASMTTAIYYYVASRRN